MSTIKEARSDYLTEWLNLSIALRNTSDSAQKYIAKLREAGEKPNVAELPIFLPKIDLEEMSTKIGKKRKGVDGDEDKPKSGKGSRGGKKPKDPNAPKRPPSAYILFQNSIRQKTREDNPSMPYGEVMKLIGEAWNKLEKESKDIWQLQANQAMEAFKEEEEKYKAVGGVIEAAAPETDGVVKKSAPKSDKKAVQVVTMPTAAESSDDSSSDEELPPPKIAPAAPIASESEETESSDDEPIPPPPPKKVKHASPEKQLKPSSLKSSAPVKPMQPHVSSVKPSKDESLKKEKKEKKRKSHAAE